MPQKILSQKDKDQLVRDLKECESIAEEIARAKAARIPGIELLEARYQECKNGLQLMYQAYGGRNQ